MFEECNMVWTATRCLSLAAAILKQGVAVRQSLMSCSKRAGQPPLDLLCRD